LSEIELEGYHGEILQRLKKAGATIGSILRITSKSDEIYEGALFPRSEYSDSNHIVLKMKNGYNIGIHFERASKIEVIGQGPRPHFQSPPHVTVDSSLPKVAIISTGGTIASRVDYRTGAVQPALTATDLANVVPEIASLAQISAEVIFSEYSENVGPEHWKRIAEEVSQKLNSGVDGIVISHGTDTMHYTSAALSYALQNLPIPVLLVGAQRSSDRPSSDAATNLTGAVAIAAKATFAAVGIVMHHDISDHLIIAHRGTRVRKCHSSERGAFQSINSPYLAQYNVKTLQVESITGTVPSRDKDRKPVVTTQFDDRAALIKFYPGFDPWTIETIVSNGIRGIILEGTGLGHVSKNCYPAIKKTIKENIPIFMTSQTIWGRVDMNVYYTGRDLLALGVTPLDDMLSETALVKLMWTLPQTRSIDEIRNLMLKPIAGDMSDRTTIREEQAVVAG
jgi:glutamyl-tRNA(Gln) amidotransferase subunit D